MPDSNTPQPAKGLHPFERSGLGRAPFTILGVSEAVYQACPGAPVQPGGTCDFCGAGIRYVFRIRAADRREFNVGCDCAERYTEDGRSAAAELHRFKAERAARARRDRETDARIAGAFEHLAKIARGLFAASMGEAMETWLREQEYLGEPGQRVTFRARLDAVIPFEAAGFDGWPQIRLLHKLTVVEGPHHGAQVVWFSASRLALRRKAPADKPWAQTRFRVEKGMVCYVRATVKKRETYEGVRQTVVQRAAAVPKPKKEKKA